MSNPWGFNDFMVIAGFRYCLGRRTYAVEICADWLIEQWPNFKENIRGAIKRELEQEFSRDDIARDRNDDYWHLPLGADCDRAEWERVRGLWK